MKIRNELVNSGLASPQARREKTDGSNLILIV
jgi:hypothetical protein